MDELLLRVLPGMLATLPSHCFSPPAYCHVLHTLYIRWSASPSMACVVVVVVEVVMVILEIILMLLFSDSKSGGSIAVILALGGGGHRRNGGDTV